MSSRRAHTKTRTGCQQCKRRKVKCDERRPSCFNCTRYNVQCSLAYPQSATCPACGQATKFRRHIDNGLRSDEDISLSKNSIGYHGCTPSVENSEQNVLDRQMDAIYNSINASIITSSFRDDGDFDTTLLNLRDHDFELMHHWCTTAYSAMGVRDELRNVWKNAIPLQGYSHPYVMHGLMALSASHKAYLLYDKADRYLTLSAYHYTRGQSEFRRNLSGVTDDNCKPVFCFSLILIVYMCAIPVTRSPNHIIDNPIQTTLELFSVCRGLRAATHLYYDQALKSDLWPLARTTWLSKEENTVEIPMPSLDASPLPADTFEAIDSLQDFLRSRTDLEHFEEAEEAVSWLRVTAVQVAIAGIQVELGNVILWPHNISDALMYDLKQLTPHALLILAYFTPLLRMADRNFWFLEGWSKYLLADIEGYLKGFPEFIGYLGWPKTHVK